MLISLKHKFIFVATLKTASTAIENALGPLCEIRISRTEWGKHLGLSLIEKRLSWIFKFIPRKDFTVFGVIRDPVEFLVSLYNSHQKSDFIPFPRLYTGNLSLDGFIGDWLERHKSQGAPQSGRFLDHSGHFGMSYIARHDKLEQHLSEIMKRVGLAMPVLKRENASPIGIKPSQVGSKMLNFVKTQYAIDYAVIENLTGRWLDDADRMTQFG